GIIGDVACSDVAGGGAIADLECAAVDDGRAGVVVLHEQGEFAAASLRHPVDATDPAWSATAECIIGGCVYGDVTGLQRGRQVDRWRGGTAIVEGDEVAIGVLSHGYSIQPVVAGGNVPEI